MYTGLGKAREYTPYYVRRRDPMSEPGSQGSSLCARQDHPGVWSLCRPALYGMSNAGRGALAVCDEPRSQDPCKPFLIGGHSWGSEHLKLFFTQQNRIEAALAPGTWAPRTSVRRRCHWPSASCPDHSRTQPYRENPPPGLLMSINAHQADADAAAAACSLARLIIVECQPAHTHTHPACTFHTCLPSLFAPSTGTLHRAASYMVPYGGHIREVAHTPNLDSHRDCSPGLRHSVRRSLHARQNTPPSLPAFTEATKRILVLSHP